ncbi:hypothetical protein ACFWBC_10125 [Streptomyces sp. NPDC059985]|uniref:hypothetical protein n=1 Tax=Streptomyces sp. NPDC059985 TaxID=3347025 RepID=UPI0036BBBC70
MLTTETVRTNPTLSEDQALRVAELWTIAYPDMRAILDTVIKAQRSAERPTVEVARLETVRRELGQLHRATFKSCTRSAGGFSHHYALVHVQEVLDVTSNGNPVKGALHRLAGELADLEVVVNAAASAYFKARKEPVVPAPRVDRDPVDRADSEQTERGLTR